MITRHSEKYGEDVCKAYLEVAEYKWTDSFVCRRPGCAHNKYFEGSTPYSRRCLKCKRDESVTAHTIFDKLRMPLPAYLEIVRVVMEKKERQKIEELTDYLRQKNYKGVNAKSVWAFLSKLYSVMSHEPVRFDTEAYFAILAVNSEFYHILSLGRSKGKISYNYNFGVETRVHDFIKRHTEGSTKTALFNVMYPNTARVVVRKRSVSYRPDREMNPNYAKNLAKGFMPWQRHIGAYLYKKNGKQYEDLMSLITKSYTPEKRPN